MTITDVKVVSDWPLAPRPLAVITQVAPGTAPDGMMIFVVKSPDELVVTVMVSIPQMFDRHRRVGGIAMAAQCDRASGRRRSRAGAEVAARGGVAARLGTEALSRGCAGREGERHRPDDEAPPAIAASSFCIGATIASLSAASEDAVSGSQRMTQERGIPDTLHPSYGSGPTEAA